MNISDLIKQKYPTINPDQEKIIEHDDGPLLVIAGPGSGKTFSMVLRTIMEETLEAAIQEFTYKPEKVKQAGIHFDSIVSEIQNRNYEIVNPPDAKIFRECDFRHVYRKEGVIE